MQDAFIRSEMLLGSDAIKHLSTCHVAVFGLGGVGSYVVEGLVRSGIGKLTLVDYDSISQSNLNRQLIALSSTIGQNKTTAVQNRVLDINPNCEVIVKNCFFNQESLADFNFSDYDYVVDAIDTVSSKLLLVTACSKTNTPIISAMGAGNKLDPTSFKIGDVFDTSIDPLARVMRKELRKRGIRALKVVYSTEEPIVPLFDLDDSKQKESSPVLQDQNSNVEPQAPKRAKRTPGSVAFVPSVAGLIIASEVIRDLIE